MNRILAAALVAWLPTQAFAQVIRIDLGAELLKNADGTTPMPTTGLVVLVASTTDGVFAGPTATTFVSGDDVVLKKWDLSAFKVPGAILDTTGPLTLGDPSISVDWNAGDPLVMYWYPELNINSSQPGAGTKYGQYRDPALAAGDPSPLDGSARWFTPPAQSLISLNFYTADATQIHGAGSNPASAGIASLTVVPEPSAYTTVFGAFCLFGAVISRRFRKRLV